MQKEHWKDKETVALMASFISLVIILTCHFPMMVAKLNCLAIAICGMLCKRLED